MTRPDPAAPGPAPGAAAPGAAVSGAGALPARQPRTGPSVLGWLGVALTVGCALLAGLLELMLVPLYAGSVVLPVAVLFAVAGNVALPRRALSMVPAMSAAVAPFIAWLVVAVYFAVIPRPEGDYISPAGGFVEYVYFGTLLGGALAGTITVVLCAPARPR